MRQFRRGILLVGVLISAAGGGLRAEPATAPATIPGESELDRILLELRADDFAAREKGSADLVALGVKGMPAIKKLAAAETDPETKIRLQKAYDALEEQFALVGELVTIDMKGASPAEIINEIGRQTGKKFSISGEATDKKFDFKVARMPMFLALAELHKKIPFLLTSQGGVELGVPGILQVSADGAVAFIGGGITRPGKNRSGEAPAKWPNDFSVCFLYAGNFRLSDYLLLQEISDDAGNILLAAPAPGDDRTGGGESWSDNYAEFTPTIKFPETPGSFIKELSGKLTVVAVIHRETVAIPYGSTAPKELYSENLSIKWDLQGNGDLNLEVRFNRGNIPDEEFDQLKSAISSYRFLDENGKELRMFATETSSRWADAEVSRVARYRPKAGQLAALKKGKIVFQFPTRTKTITLDFSVPKIAYPK